MACCELGDGVRVSELLDSVKKLQEGQENSETMKKFQEDQEYLETMRISAEEEKERNRIAISRCSSVWYDGDPTRCDRKTVDILKECTDFALEIYNKTHHFKYIFVELVHATGHLLQGFVVEMKFTARPKKDDCAKNAKTFRARVSITDNYVEYVEFVPPPDGDGMKEVPKLDHKRELNHKRRQFDDEERMKKRKRSGRPGGSTLWYDVDTKQCSRYTMRTLKECAGLAIDIYNKTHPIKYSLLDLVHAIGHLSAGNILNMMFTAKPTKDEDDTNAKTFRARVNSVYMYVEYVEFVPPADLLVFYNS